MKKIILGMLTAVLICCAGILMSCATDNGNNKSDSSSSDTKRDRARYTVIIYGNAGGRMDYIIERMWGNLKPMLKDKTNVRVFVLYKYGIGTEDQLFTGQYGNQSDVMMFELNSNTDLTQLKNTENNSDFKLTVNSPGFELYDSKSLAAYIKAVKEYAPADNYIFTLWGHGGGYDILNDRPDNMVVSRGVLYDETLEGKGMNMYQFSDALATCNTHFQLIMFHNCLMGNIETLTEVQPYADYFFASSHLLSSFGQPIEIMIEKLIKSSDYNFENTAKEMFVDLKKTYNETRGIPPEIMEQMKNDMPEGMTEPKRNYDFKIIRSADLTNLNNNISFFVSRLLELYQDLSNDEVKMKKVMTDCAYAYEIQDYTYLIDLKKYIQTVAAAINDTQLSAHAKNVIDCIDNSIIQRWDYSVVSQLKEFSLSVMLPYHDFLHYETKNNYTVAESYYPSSFNRRTGWALWMDANRYFPTKWMFDTELPMGSPEDADIDWDMLRQEVLERNSH